MDRFTNPSYKQYIATELRTHQEKNSIIKGKPCICFFSICNSTRKILSLPQNAIQKVAREFLVERNSVSLSKVYETYY
jgi:hypothetical protein